jgi:hypothetical protein
MRNTSPVAEQVERIQDQLRRLARERAAKIRAAREQALSRRQS